MRRAISWWHGIGAGVAMAALVLACFSVASAAEPDRVLYNGIELPAAWPPSAKDFPNDPQRPPYLISPPKVIAIDVGRQLFVDDFLIEATTLKRAFHQPEYYAGNPVLKPDRPWEMTGRGPFAVPFSDGVWYDPQDGIFPL